MGINVMLFASISGIMNSKPEILYEDPPLPINKYYYQKYIKDRRNVLIVGSASGSTLETNLNLATTPDISQEDMDIIEGRLRSINLTYQ